MKKSEALNILGLSDGATDDEVKAAHRRLVIAHHPDKFKLESPERAEAEEFTKRINEARDVLLNRSWTPEFDPRRDPRPYAGNPYAHPSANPYGAPQPGRGAQDPFSEWPFGQGQGQSAGQGRTTYVWTSWDGTRSAGGEGAGAPNPFDFDPFDPFAPFRASSESRKTSQQVKAETREALKKEGTVIAAKAAALLVLSLAGSPATGLFVYVVASIVYGLWKRLGSCLIGFFVPIALVLAPLVFIIAPRQGAVTIGLGLAFLVAVLFDVVNVRDLVRVFRAADRASS